MEKLFLGLYLLIGVLVMGYRASPVLADPLTSSHYQFQETSLGGTGLLGASSANYQAAGTGSILGLGALNSSDFILQAGNQTTGDPALAFAVNSAGISFNSLFSAASTATATATFQVADYTSYGYIVQIIGTPPVNGSHTITALATAAQPTTGTDQFGINVVANTLPSSLGANPNNGQFGFGQAAANYNTPNFYRYVSTDTIALGTKSSGLTTYTISFIVDVSGLTPGGQYTSGQTLLCTATY
jgi:hypothetical protein